MNTNLRYRNVYVLDLYLILILNESRHIFQYIYLFVYKTKVYVLVSEMADFISLWNDTTKQEKRLNLFKLKTISSYTI